MYVITKHQSSLQLQYTQGRDKCFQLLGL